MVIPFVIFGGNVFKNFLKEMETVVHFLDWIFAVDKELTESVYANVLKGGAEECGCSMCRNYIQYRENIFPNEVKKLFIDVGINLTKDVEIYHMGQTEFHLHWYGGWFNLAGRILKGKESIIEMPTGSFTQESTEISPHFSIGFHLVKNPVMSLFENIEAPIIQVSIDFKIPWVISEEEPD